MLTSDQLKEFSKLYKINESVIAREYVQILFLKELYDETYSKNIYFKGGTAIRLILEGSRFSEDLDFTVMGGEANFEIFIIKFFEKLEKLYGFSFKRRNTIAGIKYLLTSEQVFINLDFSFRENVLKPDKSTIITNYPVIFTSFIRHLSGEEIIAEKIRAITTREKGRDIYDLWFLLSKNIKIDKNLVEAKLKYYDETFDTKKLVEKINKFSKEKFILDLKPFVSISEREKLGELFDYIIFFLDTHLIL